MKLFCQVQSSASLFEIEIGHRLLNNQAQYLSALAANFAIITDDQVAPLYAHPLKTSLNAACLRVEIFSFPKGEQYKTRATKESLENQLFERGFGKDCCIIALGGGVVCDLAGYLAATFCRGVPLLMFPTSLMAMIDASIGGKNGVNLPYGKNLLGTIYQPKKIVIDLDSLQSLPPKEFANGIVEMIKHGLIANAQLFEMLEEHTEKLLALDPDLLKQVIFTNCLIKKEIVEQDEKESGKRRLLNFGHTVGHALEKLTHYTLSHGEAVAIGLVVESYLSAKLGTFSYHSVERIRDLLLRCGLSLRLPCKFAPESILEATLSDKKSLQGVPRFVTLKEIGIAHAYDANYCTHINSDLIKEAFIWMNDALCCH